MSKLSVADILEIEQWEPVLNERNVDYSLKGLRYIATVADRIQHEADPAILKDLIDDLMLSGDIIDKALMIIGDYANVEATMTCWEDEVESRLTPSEREQFEQRKLIHKLKGE